MISIPYEMLSVLALLSILAVAAVIDIQEHRVPNPLVGMLICVGCLLYLMQLDMSGFLHGCLGLAVGLFVFLPFYIFKGMGAGDVKLMAACGLYLGPEATLYAAGASMLVGGIIAAGYVVAARVAGFWPQMGAVLTVDNTNVMKKRLPFAGSIAAGVALVAVLELRGGVTELLF